MATGNSVDELAGLISRSLFTAFLRGAEQWARLDVTMPQMKVLMLLAQQGSAQVSRLAQQMCVSPPNVTGILDRLEDQGRVRRMGDEHDRRMVRVVLTDEGRRILDRLQQASEARTRSRLMEMALEDQAALQQGLLALMHSMSDEVPASARDPVAV